MKSQMGGFRSFGHDVTIWEMAKIVGRENIILGNSVIIDDFVFIMGGESTRIGDFVHIASFASILGGGEFVMGDFSAVSSGCRVYTGNDDYSGTWLTNPTVPQQFRRPTRSFVNIGRHAIVGANSVILPGVSIGEGTAIGAGSVVTRDCEPWTIYVGAPARPLRERPRERLLALERELRLVAYDPKGNYVPRVDWNLDSQEDEQAPLNNRKGQS